MADEGGARNTSTRTRDGKRAKAKRPREEEERARRGGPATRRAIVRRTVASQIQPQCRGCGLGLRGRLSMVALGSRTAPHVGPQRPVFKRYRVGRTWSASASVSRLASLALALGAGCALRGSRQSASATGFKGGCVGQGLGVRPELPWMRPSTPQLLVETARHW